MLNVGDRVKYRDMTGVVKSVMDDMVIVTFQDGKDYPMAYNTLTKETGEAVTPPINFSGIISTLKPYLKDMQFIGDLAKEMNKAGVSDLNIHNGAIVTFTAKESYEEKLLKYKATALAEAERKAKEEFDRENAQ